MKTVTLTAKSLISLFGVNTHCGWDTVGWTNAATVEKCMTYVNAQIYRDLPPANSNIQAEYGAFFKATGAKLCALMAEGAGSSSEFSQLTSMLKAYPGSILCVEGVNETTAGASSANASQKSLYASIKGNSALASLPVASYSLAGGTSYTPYGNQAGIADWGNCHPYANASSGSNGGVSNRRPEPNMDSGLASVRSVTTSLPVIFTELGGSLGSDESWAQDTSDADRAINTIRAWMYGAILGVKGVAIYELMDNDASGSSENTFGLFTSSGSPRAAATAVKNLMAKLADTSTTQAASISAPTVSGCDFAVIATKGDGSAVVIAWNSTSTTQASITAKTSTAIAAYSPFADSTSQSAQAATLSVSVGPSPVVFSVGAAAGSATGSTSTGTSSSGTTATGTGTTTTVSGSGSTTPVSGSGTSTGGTSTTKPSSGGTYMLTDLTQSLQWAGQTVTLTASSNKSGGGYAVKIGTAEDTTTTAVTKVILCGAYLIQVNKAGGAWQKRSPADTWTALPKDALFLVS